MYINYKQSVNPVTSVEIIARVLIITSAKEVCFHRRLFVWWSVCLLATSRKNYWPDLHEDFTEDNYIFGQRK